VFVGNIPYTVTWQQLKDVFRECGNVLRADVPQDEKGRSKGFGIVLFETQDEAHRAIEMMNEAEFNGRKIFLKMDDKI